MATNPPDYVAGQIDTAPDGGDKLSWQSTSATTSVKDTSTEPGARAGSQSYNPAPPAGSNTDTTGTNGTNQPVNFHPVDQSINATGLDTSTWIDGGGTPFTAQAYNPNSGKPVPASNADTTLTDVQAAGSLTNPTPSGLTATNIDVADLGSPQLGGPPAPGASVAVAPAQPTVATGPRRVTVTFTPVADPTGDKVTGYVILGSTGGTTFVGRNATFGVVEDLVPDQNYTFKVAARTSKGLGAFSPASAAVSPYNPDEPDKARPAGLSPANTVNAIYTPQGTVKAGTGLPGAPVIGASTAGAAGSKQVTANWSAPAAGVAPTSYQVTAYLGGVQNQQVTVSGASTSSVVTFAASGGSATFTVRALNSAGVRGPASAASAAVTVP